jgi:hypothetical protein
MQQSRLFPSVLQTPHEETVAFSRYRPRRDPGAGQYMIQMQDKFSTGTHKIVLQ